MAENIDQIFVLAWGWLVRWVPEPWQIFIGTILKVSVLIAAFATLFALTTWLERKGLGRIQNRLGPNRVGPFGLLQPIADGIKSLTKEDIVPRTADALVHFLAPIVLVVPVFLALATVPIGRNMVLVDFDAGLLFFFAVGAATEVSVFMAGWSSRNKYSLLGAMRALAQMISYEVPLILSSIPVVMIAGTLSPALIVHAQDGYGVIFPNWHVFTPWGFAGFVLFMIAAAAESNRSPFDLPEGESEIIAGYYIEYSGFKFALFFLAEYIGMFATSGMAITLFLGGWHAPVSWLEWVPSWAWFFLKLLTIIAGFIWVRGTLPRLRMDQLMNFAWKFMLPMALVNLVTVTVWKFMEPGLPRWIVCILLVVLPYVLLGTALSSGRITRRSYKYAD